MVIWLNASVSDAPSPHIPSNYNLAADLKLFPKLSPLQIDAEVRWQLKSTR